MRQAHFTVLLRSVELRYAKAGFPTKVVEGLATGTPVISNITSDLGDYLRHRENALLVDGCSAEAFKTVLEQALMLSSEEKKALSINSRRCAEKYLDYRSYITQFKSFME